MVDATPKPISRNAGLLVTGLVAWASVLAAGLVGLPRTVGSLTDPFALGWLAVMAVFGAEVVLGSLPSRRAVGGTLDRVRTAALSALALGANWLVPLPMPGVAIGGVLLVVVASKAAMAFPRPAAFALIGVQSVALALIYRLCGWPWSVATVAAGAFVAFQLLAYVLGWLAESERRARENLALSLAELRSTQSLLADAAAQAERHRIDRELHDVLGHHLTALSLQLQRAGALSSGEPAELIGRAHHLTRLVLADVRSVVSEATPAVNLPAAVGAMREAVPGVTVTLEGSDALNDLSSGVAHTVLRCVQECVTNAVRHGRATRVRVDARRRDGRLEVTITDNGRGMPASPRSDGTGLRGLDERAGALGGTVYARSGHGGVEVVVTLPLPSEAMP